MHREQTWTGTASWLTIFWILLSVLKGLRESVTVKDTQCEHAWWPSVNPDLLDHTCSFAINVSASVFSSTEYRTRVPAVKLCDHFLTDRITRASLLKAMNADEVPTFQISEPISTGMVEVRNLTIQGLHMARMTRPIQISEQMSGSLPVLRLELWVALEQLNIDGEARLRLKTSKPKPMTILVKPSNLYIALDLRTRVKTQDYVVPVNGPSFTVHSVSFIEWNGIRINGKGFMLKLFRLMGGSNAFAGTIRRCVEKTIHKQIAKALDKFPPNMLLTSLLTQDHTGSYG